MNNLSFKMIERVEGRKEC